jgi:hypothetical protein
MPPESRYVTPPALATLWGVTPEKVIDLIRAGELDAVNLASRGSSRPRFRISPEAIQRFEHCRSIAPRPAAAPRRSKTTCKLRRFI